MQSFSIKIVDETIFEEYFQLIENNRERLRRYFPITLSEVEDKVAAKKQLAGYVAQMKNREIFPFGIFDKEKLIGWVSIKNINWRILKCELGYYIDGQSEGQGVMSFALEKTIDYCFTELEMEKVFLRIGPENIGSKKLALKNGFQKEGVLRKEFRIETGELIDVEYYGLLREEKPSAFDKLREVRPSRKRD